MTRIRLFSIALLAMVCFIIFLVPNLPLEDQKYWYNGVFTVLIIAAAWAVDTNRRIFFPFAVATIVIEWVAELLEMNSVLILAQFIMILFFMVVVVGLITQIARTRRVTLRVIIDAITGYLMLGLVFMILVMLVSRFTSEAYTFSTATVDAGHNWMHYSQAVYFTFVTYTTLGYGDILPLTPLARSLTSLTAVAGQIYLTVIIAMLVGKFLSHSQEQKNLNH